MTVARIAFVTLILIANATAASAHPFGPFHGLRHGQGVYGTSVVDPSRGRAEVMRPPSAAQGQYWGPRSQPGLYGGGF